MKTIHFVLFLTLFCCNRVAAESTTSIRWADIVEAWTARAVTVPVLRATVSEVRFSSPDAAPPTSPRRSRYGSSKAPTETTLKSETTFLAHGGKWKVETHGDKWAEAIGKVVQVQEARAFDGNKRTAYEFVDAEPSHTTRPGWVESKASACTFTKQPQLIPWMIILRPFDECSVISPTHWTAHGDITSFQDGDTQLLRQELKTLTGQGSIELWLERQHPFVLRRYSCGLIIVEIQWKNDALHGSFPSHFRCTQLNSGGGVNAELEATVTSIEFDVAVTDTDFQVEFPKGTVVRDTTSGRVPNIYYVKRDGSHRQIVDSEWRQGLDYNRLETTSPGSSAHASGLKSSKMYYIGAAVVAMAMGWLGYVLLRRLRC